MSKAHAERKHSKFSASGAERWFECSGSIALSEGLPDKPSIWSQEGTDAHEKLEALLKAAPLQAFGVNTAWIKQEISKWPAEMRSHVVSSAKFILQLHKLHRHSELLTEQRVFLDFIHPEAFGTLDSAIVDYFGTLHVLDFKYGAGHSVSPKENLQMIFYALALAHAHQWNFKRVKLWIIQPRIKGYDGPTFWDISIEELRAYIPAFREAVKRVEQYPDQYKEGGHCHWCKAKSICPLKRQAKIDSGIEIFKTEKGEKQNGKKENKEKSSQESKHQKSVKKESDEALFKSEAGWKKEKVRKAQEKRAARNDSKKRRAEQDFY